MLDAYIIEEIKKQEEERLRRNEAARPRMHIEIPSPGDEVPPDGSEETPDEGTAIRIDL